MTAFVRAQRVTCFWVGARISTFFSLAEVAFLTRHRGFVRERLVRTPRMTAFVRAPVTARPWVGDVCVPKPSATTGLLSIRMASPRADGAGFLRMLFAQALCARHWRTICAHDLRAGPLRPSSARVVDGFLRSDIIVARSTPGFKDSPGLCS